MKLIIASNNAHKLVEIKAILGSMFEEILSLREAGIDHETIEDGDTFLANAAKKAREIAQISGCCALADDSGLCVDALGGAPGIYSARYSGVHGDDKANNRKLLEELKDVPDEQRGAHFTCAIVLARPDGSQVEAEGYFYGRIAHGESGENGFPRRKTASATAPTPSTSCWRSWERNKLFYAMLPCRTAGEHGVLLKLIISCRRRKRTRTKPRRPPPDPGSYAEG